MIFRNPRGRVGVRSLFAIVMGLTCGVTALAQGTDPVRIGLIYSKQGPGASIGQFLERGSEIALEQAGGKVLGRPVELVWLDEPNPQVSQQNMQKLVDENKVVAVVGGNYSSSALAMMSVANRAKVPLILPGAAASEITGKDCSRYTFRTQATVPVQIGGVMPYLSQIGKKVYFLTPSYAFGQDILRSARSRLKENGMTEVGVDEVPVNTADYSSYILKIRQAKPDVVLGGLVGGDFSNFLKQWNEMGMKDKIPYVAVAVTDTDFWDVGPQASAGIYVKPWYYNNPKNTAAEKQFTADFEKKYGRPPSDKAWSGWIAMRSLLESINAAKATDSKSIVTQLEKWKNTDGAFPFYFRDWDHQLVRPSVVVRVKSKITDKYDFFDVVRDTSNSAADTEKAFGDRQQVGCNMPPL
ncbi:amino acid/amide ABC transporter substrate-binding protein, HAAT family [Paraburkholderia fungorum]|uniref:Amino acid/amide ABC transporter substrate-binding protein, HAAT family n=1 Tax=Paraburkholderia fungorum TaxID=134537 RepID=A0A1H1JLJ9_9BURK|nr:ABC transporter substrate-binding protein [Paraburkholderia fungorum]SDR50780.1 amino acid/amide ABC transporter substrate-binding protein, HAAT family [Paraburkholderia fungorum]